MNTTKNISISRYILSLFAAIALLIGLTLSLSSCEKDPLSGEPVTVRFTIASSTYGAGEEIRASQAVEPETVVTYLGNGLLMETTLEPDVPATRAALVPFDKPTKVYIVAYNSSKQYAGHLIIVAATATTTVEDNLTLSAGDTYTFVSFACYDAASAAAFDSWVGSRITNNDLKLEDLNPSIDLLYGKEVKLITTDTDVTITMKHWFSRITGVTVVNRAGVRDNITDLANVSLVTCKADLELFSGAAVKKESAEISHLVTGGWGGINDTIVYSTAALSLLVYPDKGLVLNIGKITIDGDDYAGSATFDRILVSGTSYTVRATLKNLPPTVKKPVEGSWVGAFWRASETGERIIKIAHTGTWFATVTEYDGRWDPANGDGIVLSKTPSIDPGITWNAATETPATGLAVEDYQVLGSSTVNGVAAGEIYLRIGLQKTGTAGPKKSSKWDYTNTPTYGGTSFPARYATVTIYYGSTAHLIYLRQGEGADYVMRPNDGGGGELGVPDGPGARPKAVRLSPYNLTAANLNTQAGLKGAGPNPGIFTDYPTQAGAFFQWANDGSGANDRVRFAWNPHTPTGAGLSPAWDNSTVSDYWDVAGATHETCPSGYRRPDMGITHGATFHPPVGESEYHLSLWLNPYCSTNDVQNSVFGYYADGFFDRRQLQNGPGSPETEPGILSSVSTHQRDIAHIGRLFFNPNNDSKASLFFPAAGIRFGDEDGTLYCAGRYHMLWSSSSFDNYQSNVMYGFTNWATCGTTPREDGLTIRCIRPEPDPEPVGGVISDPWSGGDTDTKDQWVNW